MFFVRKKTSPKPEPDENQPSPKYQSKQSELLFSESNPVQENWNHYNNKVKKDKTKTKSMID